MEGDDWHNAEENKKKIMRNSPTAASDEAARAGSHGTCEWIDKAPNRVVRRVIA